MRFGLTGNTRNDDTRNRIRRILEYFNTNRIDYVLEDRFARMLELESSGITLEQLGESTDMIIAFGGDGTLLCVSVRTSPTNTPILGVNAGHLGFLTEITLEEVPKRVKELIDGKYEVEKRLMLTAYLESKSDEKFYALNDIVVDKGGFPRSLKAALHINSVFCHLYSSDGFIVSTATGSTAYSLSAGGPIVYPTLTNLMITPVCPHTLSARPMIIPGDFKIEITLEDGPEKIPVHADGRPVSTMSIGEKIVIEQAPNAVKMVHFPEHEFIRVLRTKMNWGTSAGSGLGGGISDGF